MRMIYLQLYLSFLQVGLFSVGGGYAAMPLIRSQVVELHPWMTLQEFTNLITIADAVAVAREDELVLHVLQELAITLLVMLLDFCQIGRASCRERV